VPRVDNQRFEYILKKTNLRNYVVIGNKDTQKILANNTFGKVTQIKVAYVWFKVKNKHLLCTENEYNQNIEIIRKCMNAESSECGSLNAESIEYRERIRIRDYHKFLSELSLSQISKVVSSPMILLVKNFTSSLSQLAMSCRIYVVPFTH
jgi:hypothetical protein